MARVGANAPSATFIQRRDRKGAHLPQPEPPIPSRDRQGAAVKRPGTSVTANTAPEPSRAQRLR